MSDNIPAPKGSGKAITSLIIGIVALLLCLIPIINNFAAVLAIIGLIFGILAWRGAKKGKSSGKGMATAGTILAVISLIGVFASQAFYSAVLDDVSDSLDKADDTQEVTVTEGKAFTQHDWDVAAGWKVTKDSLGDLKISGVTVTNMKNEKRGPWIEFKLWQGKKVLASASCLDDDLAKGESKDLDCGGTDKMPKTWDKITVEDAI